MILQITEILFLRIDSGSKIEDFILRDSSPRNPSEFHIRLSSHPPKGYLAAKKNIPKILQSKVFDTFQTTDVLNVALSLESALVLQNVFQARAKMRIEHTGTQDI